MTNDVRADRDGISEGGDRRPPSISGIKGTRHSPDAVVSVSRCRTRNFTCRTRHRVYRSIQYIEFGLQRDTTTTTSICESDRQSLPPTEPSFPSSALSVAPHDSTLTGTPVTFHDNNANKCIMPLFSLQKGIWLGLWTRLQFSITTTYYCLRQGESKSTSVRGIRRFQMLANSLKQFSLNVYWQLPWNWTCTVAAALHSKVGLRYPQLVTFN